MAPNTSESPYLTKKEAAALVRVDPRTLDNWIARKKLKSYKVGGTAVLLKRADVLALITPAPPLMPRERSRSLPGVDSRHATRDAGDDPTAGE